MKFLTRAAILLALLSGIAIAGEVNCPGTQDANACGLLARGDGYDKTPGGQRTLGQGDNKSQSMVDVSTYRTTA
jgi:hypothetical protein